MAGTITGDVVLAWIGPYAQIDPDAPDGVREVDQLNLSIRAAGDEKEYQCIIPAEKGPTEAQCEDWQKQGIKVTVFYSTLRVNLFALDPNAKGPDGKPKVVSPMQAKITKALTVGKNALTAGYMLTYQGYKVEAVGTVNLDDEAKFAHGAFLQSQAEWKKRSVAGKKQKAKEQVEKKKQEVKQQKKVS